jgi:hypothetical protein
VLDFEQVHPISASIFLVAFPWAHRFSVALDLKNRLRIMGSERSMQVSFSVGFTV